MTAAIVIVLLVIPLSFSLLLSFNCTLWLISSITSSSWKLFVILLVDALVTLIAPAVLLNIFIYFGIQAGVYIAGGLVDYSSFNSANILTLSMGLAAYLINLSFIGLTDTSWFMYMTPDWIARLIVFVIQLFFLGLNIYHTVAGFVFDTWKAVHFDFSTGYVAGTINWAIVVDIFYSAVFLIPGLLIVLVQRWAFGQRMVLNCIQLIAEHPIGPVYAIGSGLSWLAGATAKLFTGK